MKLAMSGSRGVMWRANPRGTQDLRRPDGARQRGDWWIRWACPHGHLHRRMVGPKSLARTEAERSRIDRPCPRRQPKPASHLLGDVIREYLDAGMAVKRSWKNDKRYGDAWTVRFPGRTLEVVAPAELEKIRTQRLAGEDGLTPASVNREFAFLKHVFNVAIRDGKTERN